MPEEQKEIINLSESTPLLTIPVLMVEDDEDDMVVVSDIIKEISPAYQVHTISKGEVLSAYLDAKQLSELPSLMILDYNMAPVSGIEILKTIKMDDRYKHIPVVVYSHSTYPKHKEECMAAGACAYLTKSNTIKEVTDDVRKMLSYCLHGWLQSCL